MPTLRALVVTAALLTLAAGPARAAGDSAQDPVLQAMTQELDRSMAKLKNAEAVPLYYLAYGVQDSDSLFIKATLGSLEDDSRTRQRLLDVDVRVGGRELDNTHELKGRDAWMNFRDQRLITLPVEDAPGPIRAAIWYETDKAYKEALKRFAKVKTNRAVTAEEEDRSDDFSAGEPVSVFHEKIVLPPLPSAALRAKVKRFSLKFKEHPLIHNSEVSFTADAQNRYLATSEGTRVQTGNVYLRLAYDLSTVTADGMVLRRSNAYDGVTMEDMPSDEKVLADIDRSIAELEALSKAPIIQPYSGPVILRNRAAAVFFHEIFGHRIEGQRQKSEAEGQTFTKKLGEQIMPSFLSVYDDPTVERFKGQALRGHYRFDDQGIPAQKVPLVERGVLKNFLMYRSPVAAFSRSNGHGRREAGFPAVARQGNLQVQADPGSRVNYEALRKLLIAEIKKQNKPYGLIFDDIQGGFTTTQRWGVQSYKVLPLLVHRIFADGRPDEAMRGVDIVGTPLASFGKITAAADDDAVFNGTCGAESGWVPVSATAPSLLVSEMEVEKVAKSQEKPPILPPPFQAKAR